MLDVIFIYVIFSLLQVLSAEDSEAPGSSPLNRAALAELTNEESVDERSPSLERNRNSMTSESSSSSSNDTLKMRGSYVHMSADEQDDALSGHSSRSSVTLLGMYTVSCLKKNKDRLTRRNEQRS